MPRAGWCSECEKWVWVDEWGGCQFGHSADSVDRVHEQPAPDEPAKQFGVGEMPSTLHRFCWGAFFLPLFWGASYGSWHVVGAWAFGTVTTALLATAVSSPVGGASLMALVGVTVASEMVSGLARLWAGTAAYESAWKREALRLEVMPGAKPRLSIDRFTARQTRWTLWGAIILGVGSIMLVPLNAALWKAYDLTYVGGLVPIVWLGAEVFLGVWLDSRMRAERSDIEGAAGDVA